MTTDTPKPKRDRSRRDVVLAGLRELRDAPPLLDASDRESVAADIERRLRSHAARGES